ncbi:type III pantothenate kinase [candidate division KSB1 bacterium]|nr:type III pantothenate kinase [candidate division KSB1 bacterium]
MLLAIDIGNTNIVIGIFEDSILKKQWRLSSTITRTADESWILLKLLFESTPLSFDQIKGIAIASVVPGLTHVFTLMAKLNFGIEPIVVNHELDLGINILYQTPDTVGADRLCNAIAGYSKFGGPLVIVDFGTATTLDVLTETGDYLGGIIAPGLELTASVLHQRAAMLPRVALKFPPRIIGNTTETSIQSGLMYGSIEMIDGMIRRIEAELERPVIAIATGGLAYAFSDQSQRLTQIEPHLTLEGLRLIYERARR